LLALNWSTSLFNLSKSLLSLSKGLKVFALGLVTIGLDGAFVTIGAVPLTAPGPDR
jgi:hypothetical protein